MSPSARSLRAAAAVFLFLLPAAGTSTPPAGPFPGSGFVVRVTDGDSLRVRFADGVERRVRLIGVDAPELDSRVGGEAFRGFLSRRFAFSRLERRDVRLEYDATAVDAFGRVLAYVFTPDGELFNELIIREGFARAFLKYPFRPDFRDRFSRAEAEARRSGRGFWGSPPPEALSPAGARLHLGRLGRVRYVCVRIVPRRGYYFLEDGEAGFEALIPQDRRRLFPGPETLVGRTIAVYGFIEEYVGRTQIVVSFPSQLTLD